MSASDKRKRLEQIIGDGEDTRPEQEEAFFATECPDSQNAEYALLLRQCQFGLFGLYAEDGQDFVGSSDDIHVEIALSLIHISEPTRHLRISYAVFCLKKKKQTKKKIFFFFFFFF